MPGRLRTTTVHTSLIRFTPTSIFGPEADSTARPRLSYTDSMQDDVSIEQQYVNESTFIHGFLEFSGFAVHRPAAAQACWTWVICAGVGVRPAVG